jgi:hypothetical protein
MSQHLFETAQEEVQKLSEAVIQSSFASVGICPWNPKLIEKRAKENAHNSINTGASDLKQVAKCVKSLVASAGARPKSKIDPLEPRKCFLPKICSEFMQKRRRRRRNCKKRKI